MPQFIVFDQERVGESGAVEIEAATARDAAEQHAADLDNRGGGFPSVRLLRVREVPDGEWLTVRVFAVRTVKYTSRIE